MQVLYDKIGAIRPREVVKQGYHVEHVMTLMLWRLEYYLLSQNHRWGVLSLDTLHPPAIMFKLSTYAPQVVSAAMVTLKIRGFSCVYN
jgi:hypothetical protein